VSSQSFDLFPLFVFLTSQWAKWVYFWQHGTVFWVPN